VLEYYDLNVWLSAISLLEGLQCTAVALVDDLIVVDLVGCWISFLILLHEAVVAVGVTSYLYIYTLYNIKYKNVGAI